jgi:glutathione S-transferase
MARRPSSRRSGTLAKLAALRRRIEADPAVIYATALESGDIGSRTGTCVGLIPLAYVIERFGD